MWGKLHPGEVVCHRQEEPGIHRVKHPLWLHVAPGAEGQQRWVTGATQGSTPFRGLETDLCTQNPEQAEGDEGPGGLPANDRSLLPRPVNNLVGNAGVCDVVGGPDAQRLVPGHVPPKTPIGTRGAQQNTQA